MGILPDWMIQGAVRIEPWADREHRPGKISFGVTSYGFDLRLADEFRVLRDDVEGVLDPKADLEELFASVTADTLDIPPHGFVLGRTVETLTIPRRMVADVVGKSTYRRVGLVVDVTPLEPEWTGTVTLELTNPTRLPIRVYAGEGICQVRFHEGTETCRVSYADKAGVYQQQTGVTLPRVAGMRNT